MRVDHGVYISAEVDPDPESQSCVAYESFLDDAKKRSLLNLYPTHPIAAESDGVGTCIQYDDLMAMTV